jgi:hypothetical protein
VVDGEGIVASKVFEQIVARGVTRVVAVFGGSGGGTFWAFDMSCRVAEEREQGPVFGEVAELYDRARPGYPGCSSTR